MALLWESPSGRFTLWDSRPHKHESWGEACTEFRDDPQCRGTSGYKIGCDVAPVPNNPIGDELSDEDIARLYAELMKLPDDETREAWLAAMVSMNMLKDALN